MKFVYGYNTNGLAHHRLHEALDVLADLGYRGVALTLDVCHLDPFRADTTVEAEKTAQHLQHLKLEIIIETGARYLLDARRKHYPSLIGPDADVRQDFLNRAADLAVILGAPLISLWSGHNFANLPDAEAEDRLVGRLRDVVDYASTRGIAVAFEPEPGMFVETLDHFRRIHDRVARSTFGLALDVGHLLVTGEEPIPQKIRAFKDCLLTVAVEDMKRGIHDHRLFGEGDLNLSEVLDALAEINYQGMISVELPRHSSQAVTTARDALSALIAAEKNHQSQ